MVRNLSLSLEGEDEGFAASRTDTLSVSIMSRR